MVKNAENISGMRADGSAAKSAAGQSTGFLKLEQQRIETVIQRIRLQQTALTAGILTGNTCFCLYPLHPVRTTCASIIQHPLFPVVINLTIACSCVSMLAERPGASSEEQQVFSITNLVFSIIFILGMSQTITHSPHMTHSTLHIPHIAHRWRQRRQVLSIYAMLYTHTFMYSIR